MDILEQAIDILTELDFGEEEEKEHLPTLNEIDYDDLAKTKHCASERTDQDGL